MEKRKTIEEYERLAETLSAARDAASDVANRALRENKILKEEVLHGVKLLLDMEGKSPSDADASGSVKEERDRYLSFISELRDVFTGTVPPNHFGKRQSATLLEAMVTGHIVNLITDANRYRHQLNEALAKLQTLNPRPKTKRPRPKAKRKRR